MGVLSMTRKGLLAAAILASLTERSWAFLTPAIWSRIQGHLRFYGQAPEASLSAVGNGVFSSAGRAAWASGSGASAFGRRLQRLDATASFSTGDFGDELNFAELRQQLAVLENQLASAMNLGRYDEAKQLVNDIMSLKEFAEKQARAQGTNPFSAMGALLTDDVLATRPQSAPARNNRPGLGAFGGAVGKRAARPGRAVRETWPTAKGVSQRGDVPMEAIRKRHSDITAFGIRVEVFCFFQPGASRPKDNLYQFQCNIRITNTNPGDVQLLGRELKIFKADGSPPEYGPASQQLESQPVVGPGSVYMYMSEFGITCIPEDKKYLGRIEGHFDVVLRDENQVVKVPIAPFWLEIPGDTLVLA